MHWGNSAESIPRFTSEHDVDDHHAGITCDLVHIDGDHSFEGAQADFQNFYPLMTCDSMILVDDVLDSNNGDTQNNGPTKLWHVLKGEGVSTCSHSKHNPLLAHTYTCGRAAPLHTNCYIFLHLKKSTRFNNTPSTRVFTCNGMATRTANTLFLLCKRG